MSLADAVLAKLISVLPADVHVYDGTAPGIVPPRYVVLFCTTGHRISRATDGRSRDVEYKLQVTSVAAVADQARSAAPEARWLSEQVRDALTDWVAVVPGLQVGPIEHVLTLQTTPDETISDRHLMYTVDQFSALADKLS